MAIYQNEKLISSIFHNDRAISYVYKGTRLVWKKVTSEIITIISHCYPGGKWTDNAPWEDNDSWNDNLT